MVTLFVGNFEFEHRLSHRQADGPLAGPLRRLTEELTSAWLAIANDGDLLWTTTQVEPEFFQRAPNWRLPSVRAVGTASDVPSGVEVCPWGLTNKIRDWADSNGWKCSVPDEDVIRQVNSRLFSARLERDWGVGLRDTTVIRSLDDLRHALRRLPADTDNWVLKAEFGMSGREKILARGNEPGKDVRNWLDKRLANGIAVVFEPWVDRVEEAGLQFTLPWSGPPVFEGVTPLLADRSGTYRGNRITCDAETEMRWLPAIETGMRAAREIRQLGYFGPLGIDAIRYRDHDGRIRLRSLQDINARHTMGRLGLGLRRLLDPGEVGTWLHLNRKSADLRGFGGDWDVWLQSRLSPGTRFVRTSPLLIDQRPVEHMTVVIAGQSTDALRQSEDRLIS